MTDNDQGKTQVRAVVDKKNTSADKTRIAAARPQNGDVKAGTSKTIAKPAQRRSVDADQTRVPPRPSSPDRTRIQAGVAKSSAASRTVQKATSSQRPDDKTRVAARRNPAAKDATLFKPAAAARKADKTRIQASARSAPKTQVKPGAEATERPAYTDQHVLKKRFVLERVLGAGGMGIVYKAKDLLKVEAKDRDPYVAIKVLSEEFKAHPEAFISLQRESRKSQRIAHPNIVNVHDFDRDGDTVFMTMEFLDGHPLDELIHRYQTTGLPTDDAWDIIHGMTSALSHAHAEKIIHSDFKPGNVFVTKKGLTKVFDFGIARAVAQVEHMDDNPQDHTVFDAGNLGALTPAYASLEMLEGEEPDVRDDVYALGCVAYEVLTGRHPYNKVPADEAERQGLKPKRITHIKKYQWQAIEKAIAFRRENRLKSVAEFETAIKPKLKSSNWVVTTLALLFAAAITGYFLFFTKEPDAPQYSEFDIRNELELKVRIDFYKENIDKLLQDANFTDFWQDSIWKDYSDLKKIIPKDDPWIGQKTVQIFTLYSEQIQKSIADKRFSQAELLIVTARRYQGDGAILSDYQEQISQQREIEKQKRMQQAKLEMERKKKLEQERQQQQQQQQKVKAQEKQKEKINDQFNVGLENVNTLLNCQGSINMRDFEVAVKKLKQLDAKRYQDIENNIISNLASCITTIGKVFPERAIDAQKYSLRLFDSPLLSQIDIQARDPCDISLAGLGTRGKRAMCKDKLKDSSYGPDMVVIPGTRSIQPFAMTKYEISVGQYNQFCASSGLCTVIKKNDQLPISGISIGQAEAYTKWLSQQSGKKYRLPSKTEWLHAAKSRSKKLDPNRNCELSTRGFQKGGELVYYTVGAQNGWGLVNYVGNVQEWVYQSGRKLQAVGGSFLDPMESCTISTSKSHNGSADNSTGLRVLREIENR
jgi:serine/threonine protein kinase